MQKFSSLSQDEARTRAALIDVQRYDVAVDMTGLLEGAEWPAVSTVTFTCREPGAATFIECIGDVRSAVLNGVAIDGAAEPRIALEGLAAENVLVVTSVQTNTATRTGVHRAVDHADGLVYVWTSFEPDEAQRAWACFDQPDLKAVWAFDVTAPADWIVLSSSGPADVSDVEGGRRWVFADTPRLSSYVPALNAGPFHEIRRVVGDHDLGLYCRRSLARSLERDAEELFGDTAAGLAFFGEQFAMPFPQRRYDQVFVPDLGGAMENFGCVVWSDTFLYRSTPTYGERELRAAVLLHEMAHMWFGDMVTMRWWDDLWLNEAFAEWACYWAANAVTEHTDSWASFLAGAKLGGYASDRAPSTHPIRQAAPDVATASAGFDNITYSKGASVLKQLVAYVGQDHFVEALRRYFAKHAWGNATLDDLMSEIAAVTGRDMTAWTRAWLGSAGTDVLSLEDGTLTVTPPDGVPPRPHRLDVGCYADEGDGLALVSTVAVETTGTSTVLSLPDGGCELVLLNDDDLTFAHVQPDPRGIEALLASAHRLPTAVARTVAVTTAWELLVTGVLGAGKFVDCSTRVLEVETAASVVEPLLRLSAEAADVWSPEAVRDALLDRVAETCLRLAGHPDRHLATVRVLARTASTEAQLGALEELADDIDLRWRRLVRLAVLDRVDVAEVDRLEAEDPDPDAWVRALAVRTARPDPAAKEKAWEAILGGTTVPLGSGYEIARAFWQRSQRDVLAPFGQRFLDSLEQMGSGGMIPAMMASGVLFPRVPGDQALLDELVAAVSAPGIHPIVARTVIERADEQRRILAARG